MKRALRLVAICLTLSFSAGCVDVYCEYRSDRGDVPIEDPLPLSASCVDQSGNDFSAIMTYTFNPGHYTMMPAYPGDLDCRVENMYHDACGEVSIPRGTTSVAVTLGAGKYNRCIWPY